MRAGVLDITSDPQGKWVTYARVNLETRDMYVGETGDWRRRFLEHLAATVRHSSLHPARCRRCKEHKRYTRGPRNPFAWITIPTTIAGDQRTNKRVERWAIRNGALT